mgnify:CR=1 FL=1
METISVKDLLKVMDVNTYWRLRNAGRLNMARVAPNAAVYVESIPITLSSNNWADTVQNSKG